MKVREGLKAEPRKTMTQCLASASAYNFNLLSISFVSAILAMKTKEIAFTLPITIVLYEFCFFSETRTKVRNRLKRFLYLLPILLTILIIPLSMLNIKGPQENIALDIDTQSRETINISRTDYLITQFRVMYDISEVVNFPCKSELRL